MQARILQEMTGDDSVVMPPWMTSNQPDIFDLPPLPEDIFNKDRYNKLSHDNIIAQGIYLQKSHVSCGKRVLVGGRCGES